MRLPNYTTLQTLYTEFALIKSIRRYFCIRIYFQQQNDRQWQLGNEQISCERIYSEKNYERISTSDETNLSYASLQYVNRQPTWKERGNQNSNILKQPQRIPCVCCRSTRAMKVIDFFISNLAFFTNQKFQIWKRARNLYRPFNYLNKL